MSGNSQPVRSLSGNAVMTTDQLNSILVMRMKAESESLIKLGEYSQALVALQPFAMIQKDPTEKFQIMQQIAQCKIMCQYPHTEVINKLITICHTLKLSSSDVGRMAERHLFFSGPVCAFIMYECTGKMFRDDSSADEAVESLVYCITKMTEIVKNMAKDPRMRRIAQSNIIPSIYEVLAQLRDVKGKDVEVQTQGMAQCYINIYHSHVAVRQFDKALHILEIGIALLKFQYGTKAARKRVFGYFYCNVGDVHFNSGNFTKATGCYDECIVAYQTAEDFESEETKQEWIAEIKEKIKKSRQQTGKSTSKPVQANLVMSTLREVKRAKGVKTDEVKKMMKLKDLSKLYARYQDFGPAVNHLQQLLELQDDSWNKLETLQQITGYEMMNSSKEDFTKLLTACQELQLDIQDVEAIAENLSNSSKHLASYVMFTCAAKMYKEDTDQDPDDRSSNISDFMCKVVNVLEKMVNIPDMKSLGVDRVIPLMQDMLSVVQGMRDPVGEDVKVDSESNALNNMGWGHCLVGEFDKAIKLYDEGMAFMERHLGDNTTKHYIFGFFLDSYGLAKQNQGKFEEAIRYDERALEAYKSSENCPSEDEREEWINAVKKNIENCRNKKKSPQLPDMTMTAQEGSGETKEKREKDKIKDLFNLYIEYDDYPSADSSIKGFRKAQTDSESQTQALLMQVECQLRFGRSYEDEMNQLMSGLAARKLSLQDITAKAREQYNDGNSLCAFLLYFCASKMFKTSGKKEDITGKRYCVQMLREIVNEISSHPQLRSFVTSHIIPAIYEIANDWRELQGVDADTKVDNEVWCYNNIGISMYSLKEYQKASDAYLEGLRILERHFGDTAPKYWIYANMLNNVGFANHSLSNFAEAMKYYQLSIDAKMKVENYDDENERQQMIEVSRNHLQICQNEMNKISQPAASNRKQETRSGLCDALCSAICFCCFRSVHPGNNSTALGNEATPPTQKLERT